MKRALSVCPTPTRFGFVISTILALILTSPPSGARTWKDASGKFEIEAEFVSADAGKIVLKKADGTEVSIALSKLSPADAEHVARVTDRGSHRPSSAERLAAAKQALEFLSTHRLPKPRQKIPDDDLVRASVEGLAMLATGDAKLYRDRIDDCRDYVLRHVFPSGVEEGDVGMSTRALSYALMLASEHALQFNNQRSKRLAHDLTTALLARQAEGGGWSATGITEVVNRTAEGTGIALVAMAASGKLGEIEGAQEAKTAALKFLATCVQTEPPGSGIVTSKPRGQADDSGTSRLSMIGGNAFSLNGAGVSAECASIYRCLKKLHRNLVMSDDQKDIEALEAEAFLALLFHRESKVDSADYWDHRLKVLLDMQRADGSFPNPAAISTPAGALLAAIDQKAGEKYEKQEAERLLPGVIRATMFRTLTLVLPQGELRIFRDSKR